MKFLLSVLPLLASSVLARDSFVVTLTASDFDTFVKENSPSLVEFYAPWCGHCKKLAPEYEEAAKVLEPKNVKLAKVDCTDDNSKLVCEQNSIHGYPTLKVFNEGEAEDYMGSRDSSGIVSYMELFLRPLLSDVSTTNHEDFSTSARVAVLAVVDSKDSNDFKAFEDVAKRHRVQFTFGYTTDKALATKLGVSAPGVILYKQFDEGRADYTGSMDIESIEAFINKESIPLMDEISAANYNKYISLELPMAYLFYTSPEDRKSLGEQVEAAAKDYKGKISFIYIDSNKFGAHADNLNLEQKFPAFVLHQLDKDLKFPYSDTIDQAGIAKFLKSYVDGKLKPFLKSDPVPAENNGPVYVVVGTEYENIVNDKEKDVLIEFYAPWCGFCKKLAPIYEDLGRKFQNTSVRIAKMDLTTNDLPLNAGFSVTGYPTLKLVKAGNNEVIDYSGDQSLEDLVKFVKDNASIPVEEVEVKAEAPGEHEEL